MHGAPPLVSGAPTHNILATGLDSLAVDKDSEFIFVADEWNGRVVLLSPTLEFVRYVSEELSEPRRLYFDHTTRRLFVGHKDNVAVIQL